MNEAEINMKYCPFCGAIGADNYKCKNHILIEIDSKWGITLEEFDKAHLPFRRHEITYREFCEEWDKHCAPFFEEVILKNEKYDETEHQKVVMAKEKHIIETEQFLAEHSQPSAPAKPVITCPYCKSTNTKKLSSLSRAFSAGFFGLGSSKIGKQWHCNSCGSDF